MMSRHRYSLFVIRQCGGARSCDAPTCILPKFGPVTHWRALEVVALVAATGSGVAVAVDAAVEVIMGMVRSLWLVSPTQSRSFSSVLDPLSVVGSDLFLAVPVRQCVHSSPEIRNEICENMS